MDYERIDKPQHHHKQGGLSPRKLRNVFLGADKKKRTSTTLQGEEETATERDIVESVSYSFRSQDLDHTGGSSSDNCKDVDVVSELLECSASTSADSMASQRISDARLKDLSLVNSRVRPQEDPSIADCDGDAMTVSSSIFEFQKPERAPQRVPLAPFSKPAPSKWDDAQKWIASPTTNRQKSGQAQMSGGQGAGSRKIGNGDLLSRQPSVKFVVDVPDQKMIATEEPDMIRVDSSQAKKEFGVQKFVSFEGDAHPVADSYGKPVHMIEDSVGEMAVSLSRHDTTSIAMQTASTFVPPPSTARAVSMRDMGTEMTPITSQEPSRNGTPVRSTTPIRSPTSSRPSTPTRVVPTSPLMNPLNEHQSPNEELSREELQMKTRREIMVLGTQLGKTNIAAWASKEEEDNDASTSLQNLRVEQPSKSLIGTRAASMEDAEKAKYMARFKREEMKIEAWENHQRAKAEAEIRKIEVEVERMRAEAHDKLMSKMDVARYKAEEKLAAAEAKRNRQAAKTEQQADHIRRTGRIRASFSCCGWCP